MCGDEILIARFPALAVILLFQAIIAGKASATSIVGVRTPEAFVIAADSLLVIRGGDNPVTTSAYIT